MIPVAFGIGQEYIKGAMARLLSTTLLTLLYLLILTPTPVQANLQNLNGLSAKNQTFANDLNINISSSGSIHSILWQGELPVSRGGTGASSFSEGSIPVIENGIFSDSSNLSWTSDYQFPQGALKLTNGASIHLFDVNGGYPGIEFFGSEVGDLFEIIYAHNFDGLLIQSDLANEGLGIERTTGRAIIGNPNIWPPEGTLSVLEENDSTLYIGSTEGLEHHTGCLVMGDSDGQGVTYVTANDGVLTSSATKPSVCQ